MELTSALIGLQPCSNHLPGLMFAQVVAYLWLWVVSGGVREAHYP